MFHFYSKHIRGSFNQIQPLSSSLFASQLSQSMSYGQCSPRDNRHWTGLDMDQHQHRESKMLWPGFHCVRKWKILALKTHIKGGGGGGHVHFFSYTYHPHTRCILFSTRYHSPVQSRSIPLSRNLIYHNNGFIAQPELAEEAVGDVDASKRRWKASCPFDFRRTAIDTFPGDLRRGVQGRVLWSFEMDGNYPHPLLPPPQQVLVHSSWLLVVVVDIFSLPQKPTGRRWKALFAGPTRTCTSTHSPLHLLRPRPGPAPDLMTEWRLTPEAERWWPRF